MGRIAREIRQQGRAGGRELRRRGSNGRRATRRQFAACESARRGFVGGGFARRLPDRSGFKRSESGEHESTRRQPGGREFGDGDGVGSATNGRRELDWRSVAGNTLSV